MTGGFKKDPFATLSRPESISLASKKFDSNIYIKRILYWTRNRKLSPENVEQTKTVITG